MKIIAECWDKQQILTEALGGSAARRLVKTYAKQNGIRSTTKAASQLSEKIRPSKITSIFSPHLPITPKNTMNKALKHKIDAKEIGARTSKLMNKAKDSTAKEFSKDWGKRYGRDYKLMAKDGIDDYMSLVKTQKTNDLDKVISMRKPGGADLRTQLQDYKQIKKVLNI